MAFSPLCGGTNPPAGPTVLVLIGRKFNRNRGFHMTIEQAIEAIRKASDDARKVGATEHQIIAAASARREEKADTAASGEVKALAGER